MVGSWAGFGGAIQGHEREHEQTKGRMSLKEEVQDQSQARKGEEEVVRELVRGGGEKRGDQGLGTTRYM